MQLICEGQGGHGSMMIENSPGEKVHFMLDKMTKLRQREAQRLKDNPQLTQGDITTVNLTMLEGGLQSNVVPSEMRITFDMRLAIDIDHDAFEAQVWNSQYSNTQTAFSNLIFYALSDSQVVSRGRWWHQNCL